MTAPLDLRVTVLDTWDESTLQLPPTTLISELKRTALARSRIRRSPTEYLVKYKGAELDEAGRTLADAGVAPNSSLIVMARRRLPVR
ncbi:MAG TPA: hypothetical protein VGQ69_01980 [Gemmatimonadales bacterium]|jgi:hypothetical protein|nr:hypothetical protein [Gemmatimonadales bacterium]